MKVRFFPSISRIQAPIVDFLTPKGEVIFFYFPFQVNMRFQPLNRKSEDFQSNIISEDIFFLPLFGSATQYQPNNPRVNQLIS